MRKLSISAAAFTVTALPAVVEHDRVSVQVRVLPQERHDVCNWTAGRLKAALQW